MKQRYIDLIKQTFDFPIEGFDVKNGHLRFYGVDLMEEIGEEETPVRLFYLPKISIQIDRARDCFNGAIERQGYKGSYTYCYCTKSSQFSFVIKEVLKRQAQLETSSAYDMDLIEKSFRKGWLDKKTEIVCNGFKPDEYIQRITDMHDRGFQNIYAVLDDYDEIDRYHFERKEALKTGIRVATEEEPNFEFYTSRLGVRYNDVLKLYREKIKDNPRFELKMLHFFINTGIQDSTYYWNELNRMINKYTELKKIAPELSILNIGGGMPIRNSLYTDFDMPYMVEEIVRIIKKSCDEAGVDTPDIYSEFGKYTVGESGALIFEVIKEKKQNDKERWYMLNSSFMTTMPDIWGIGEKFIMLPLNKWENEYHRVNLGGISCDQHDYYNSEMHISEVWLPILDEKEPLLIGFFHTGAYQEALSGYGGMKHCLIPTPKYMIFDRDEKGKLKTRVFSERQSSEQMLRLLGY